MQRHVATLHEMAALLFDGRNGPGTAARYNTDDPMAQTVQRQYKEQAELLACHQAPSVCQKTCQEIVKSSVACGIMQGNVFLTSRLASSCASSAASDSQSMSVCTAFCGPPLADLPERNPLGKGAADLQDLSSISVSDSESERMTQPRL